MHGRVCVIRTGCAARACVRGAFELRRAHSHSWKQKKTRSRKSLCGAPA